MNFTTILHYLHYYVLWTGGLGFWLVGYGLAFGETNSGVVGTTYFGAIGLPLEFYSHLFFQVKDRKFKYIQYNW